MYAPIILSFQFPAEKERGFPPAILTRHDKVLIPLGDSEVHQGIVTEHSGIESSPNSMPSTYDCFVCYAHLLNLNEWRLVISILSDWLRQKFVFQ